MFDASFKELLLILVLGLLVLGPERLPKVAAEIGKWVARARRTATQLRRQLEREVELDDAIQSRRERERREAAQRAAEAAARPPADATAQPDGESGAAQSGDETSTIHAPAADADNPLADSVESHGAPGEDAAAQTAPAGVERPHRSETGFELGAGGAELEPSSRQREQTEAEADGSPVHEEPPKV